MSENIDEQGLDVLEDDKKEVVELKPDRPVETGRLEQLVITRTQAFKPKSIGAQVHGTIFIYPTRFFWREQLKYNSTETEDVLCCAFATEEGGAENPRFHLKINGPVRDALSDFYDKNLENIVGKPVKLKVHQITVNHTQHLVFYPVPIENVEKELDINF